MTKKKAPIKGVNVDMKNVMLYFRIPKAAHEALKEEANKRGIFLKKLLLEKIMSGQPEKVSKV